MLRFAFVVALVAQVGAVGCGDDSDGTGTGGTMFEPGPTCLAFCAKVVETCEAFSFTESSCRQGCESDLAAAAETSAACAEALDLGFQCVTGLDCQEVYDWRDGVPADDYPCRPASVLVDANCPD